MAVDAAAGPGGEGFVADLELARLERDVIELEDRFTTMVQPIPRSGRLIITEPEAATYNSSSHHVLRVPTVSVSDTTGLQNSSLTPG